MNLGGPSAARLANGLRAAFLRPGPIWMDFDEGAVQGHGFDLYADDLNLLQLGKEAIEHPTLGPPIHARIDSVPVTKPFGQPVPFAPLLGNVQDGV